MKKIVSVLQPFAMTQDIIVYENGNKIDIVPACIEDFNEIMLNTIDKYSVEQVEFLGPKKYAQGLGNKLKEAEMLRYNTNKLKIKYL